MPLWAWHRTILLLTAWILVATINPAQNNITEAFTTSKSSDQDQFQDLVSHSLKEKATQEIPTSTVEDGSSDARRTTTVTNSETTNEVNVFPKEVQTGGEKDGFGSTEKGTLGNNANETLFENKIRTSGPETGDEYSEKKETVIFSGPTLPSALENYNVSSDFGKKIAHDETGQLENDPELHHKRNTLGQLDAIQEVSPNSTLTENITSPDTLKEPSSSENKFASLETFTRAQLMPSVSDYDEEITPDSEFFTKTTFPYGSRFHHKTSVFYSNIKVPDRIHSEWSPDLWSSVHTTQWTDPYASCSSSGCEDVYKSTVTSSLSSLYDSDEVSPLFSRTDRELWVNNYKGNTYIDPSYTATRITRTKSRIPFSVSSKGESEPDDVTVLGYIPLDEDFGMRITKTKVHASTLSHSGSVVNSPEQNRISNGNGEVTADNTIPVEFQKKTKDSDNRQGSGLGSSYSNGMSLNVFTNDGHSGGTLIKTNKWTAVKVGESSTDGEVGFRVGNSSQHTSVVTSELFLPVAINETVENLPNSLSVLHSNDMMDHINASFGSIQSRVFISTPTKFQDSVYNSFGVLQSSSTPWELTSSSIESGTNENKNEIKYVYGNISFEDTNYQKNVIDYNKQDKTEKSGEQNTAQLHSTGYVPHSSKSLDLFWHRSSPIHVSLSDSINEDGMYSGPLHTSLPYLAASSEYDGLFGYRIFSRQSPVTTTGVVLPSMISAVDAAFSPYLFSSFFDMSSSHERLRPHSSFVETPFLSTSLMNSDYLLSRYWESEKSVSKDSEPISVIPTNINFDSRTVHWEDEEATIIEPTLLIFPSSTVDPFSMHESSVLYFVSSSYPHLVSWLAGRNSTSVAESSSESESASTISTFGPPWDPRELTPSPDDHDEVPPPRITNPSCSTLPTCITMTIGMTWIEFCPLSEHLRKQLAESLSQIIKPIHPHQLVLSSDHHHCKVPGQENEVFNNGRRRRRRRRRSESFVEIRIFVVDHDGEYDEKLTEICGVILKKWMPTAGAPFQNKILEVRISHVGEEETEETSVPETKPAESPTSTGIIAAITISTIAGACLFLLCILLVKKRAFYQLQCNPRY